MNAKRLGFIIVAILLMGLSYWAMSMVNDDVKSVKVDPEQHNFTDMLNATDKGAHYIEPYYQSGYESSLIDLDTAFFFTNNVKSLKQRDAKLYILDGSGFIIIDRSKREIQGYFNSLKGYYGSQFIRIYALNKIDPDDLTILWNMRKQYVEKNKIDVQGENLFPLELSDVH